MAFATLPVCMGEAGQGVPPLSVEHLCVSCFAQHRHFKLMILLSCCGRKSFYGLLEGIHAGCQRKD